MIRVETKAVAPTNRRPNVVIFDGVQSASIMAGSLDILILAALPGRLLDNWAHAWVKEQGKCHPQFRYNLNEMEPDDPPHDARKGSKLHDPATSNVTSVTRVGCYFNLLGMHLF